MLTNEEVQQFRLIVQEAVKAEVKTELQSVVEPVKKQLEKVEMDMATKKGMSKIDHKLDKILAFLNREDVNLAKRVRSLEEHAGIPSPF